MVEKNRISFSAQIWREIPGKDTRHVARGMKARNPGGHGREMWVGVCGALVEALTLLRPKYRLFSLSRQDRYQNVIPF